MGTLLSYRHSQPLFDATLAKMADQLRRPGYVGYINLNTIVNAAGIWLQDGHRPALSAA